MHYRAHTNNRESSSGSLAGYSLLCRDAESELSGRGTSKTDDVMPFEDGRSAVGDWSLTRKVSVKLEVQVL